MLEVLANFTNHRVNIAGRFDRRQLQRIVFCIFAGCLMPNEHASRVTFKIARFSFSLCVVFQKFPQKFGMLKQNFFYLWLCNSLNPPAPSLLNKLVHSLSQRLVVLTDCERTRFFRSVG